MKNQIELISKIFNSSKNIYEFKVNLDLAGIAYEEATSSYMRECKDIVELFKTVWSSNGNGFSFEDVFDYVYPVLPCKIKKIKHKDDFIVQIQLDAISSNGCLFRSNIDFNSHLEDLAICGIDAEMINNDMLNTILRKLYLNIRENG